MRPTAADRTRAPRGAFQTINQEATLDKYPLFSSLVRARAASFPPDPQVANASQYTWVATNVVSPLSPSQDIDHRQRAAQVSAVSSSPANVTGLNLLEATGLLLMMEGRERPERETCPMCGLKIPFSVGANSRIYACCMERLCNGCTLEAFLQGTKHNCPNCDATLSKDNPSLLAALQEHAENGNAAAIYHLGQKYYYGDLGLKQDVPRAVELWKDAAELGDADAHYDLGFLYYHGAGGVEQDAMKGIRHWQQAARKGQAEGRHALGLHDFKRSNYVLAIQHWTISANMGYEESLKAIERAFELGQATGGQRAEALRGFRYAREEMRSHQRTKAKMLLKDIQHNSQL